MLRTIRQSCCCSLPREGKGATPKANIRFRIRQRFTIAYKRELHSEVKKKETRLSGKMLVVAHFIFAKVNAMQPIQKAEQQQQHTKHSFFIVKD